MTTDAASFPIHPAKNIKTINILLDQRIREQVAQKISLMERISRSSETADTYALKRIETFNNFC